MSRATIQVDDRLAAYLADIARPEGPIEHRLRETTAKMPNAGMQIGTNQAAFMALMVGLTAARRAIEVGTFTGYSALTIAKALPADGKLVCCDVSDEWTRIGRAAWIEAGVADRIDLRLGPADATLARMIAHGESDGYDLAFIDANKDGYDGYFEQCLILVRRGGLILIDNMLWNGAVADPSNNTADTIAIRALNRKLRDDQRIDFCLAPIGDGLVLARRR
jgi:predicted O-methyltransferase YrrM